MALVWSVGDESCGGEKMVWELPRLLEVIRGKVKQRDPHGHFQRLSSNGFGLDCRRDWRFCFLFDCAD